MRRSVLLLVNPLSRQGLFQRSAAIAQMEELGMKLIVPNLSSPQLMSKYIFQYHQEVDVVAVGGGDGSLSCAIKGLRETGLPLGVLPMGTANNLARNLKIPLDLGEACRLIQEGSARQIDVGTVNGHYFFNVAGLGLSTEVNAKVPARLKKRLGTLAFALFALKVVKRMRPFRAKILIPGQEPISSRSLQVTVCNGKHYGTGLQIHHEARIDDAQLDLFSAEVSPWWKGLGLLPSMMKGQYHEESSVLLLQARSFTLETKRSMPIDTDGEVTTHTPGHFAVIPRAIWVVAPPDPPAEN